MKRLLRIERERNDFTCTGQINMVKGFKDGKGRFRLLRGKKGKSAKQKSLEMQENEFDPLIVSRSKGIEFALRKGRFRGSENVAKNSVEDSFNTKLQAGIPLELAKIQRKQGLNEVKREFGSGEEVG